MDVRDQAVEGPRTKGTQLGAALGDLVETGRRRKRMPELLIDEPIRVVPRLGLRDPVRSTRRGCATRRCELVAMTKRFFGTEVNEPRPNATSATPNLGTSILAIENARVSTRG